MIIQYLLVAAFAAVLVLTWRRQRQGALPAPSAILWSLFWLAAAVIVARPEAASALARVMGVGRGADVVVYIALATVFYLVFRLFVRMESLERQLTRLVREMALKDDGAPPHERRY